MTTEIESEIERIEKPFQVVSQCAPSGDQPTAIAELTERIEAGRKDVVLLGATGTGKSATMTWLIERVQRPTLVIELSKTLAAQMAAKFHEFTPNSAVEYFVSYYNYYQPEAYVPQTDTFIKKGSLINDEVERLRHSAANSLLTWRGTVVMSSVSYIYGLDTPQEYVVRMVQPEVGQRIDRDEFMCRFVSIRYTHSDAAFARGTFRVRGDAVEVIPVYEELAIRIEFFGDEIDAITLLHPLTGTMIHRANRAHVFPASHYVAGPGRMTRALEGIETELAERLDVLQTQDEMLEAQRLQTRTNYDVEMIQNIGSCAGIEDYSRHIDGRGSGTPPNILLGYFPEDFLLIIDKSRVTVPQIEAIYKGDMSCKHMLVGRGFRLPSTVGSRPLKFLGFLGRAGQMVYLSATPGKYEIEHSDDVVEQIIRFTGFVDPEVVVKPMGDQVDDLLGQIKERVERDERVLITTLTEKMAEDLTDHLAGRNIKVECLHPDVDTPRRVELLRELRLGTFDVLVGINLLYEGLDLPEVSLVAILDTDKQGFPCSTTSLIQTVGQAARNVLDQIIMCADSITPNMREAIDETNRRRAKQMAYNREHGIDPQPLRKKIVDVTDVLVREDTGMAALFKGGYHKERTASPEAPATLREGAVAEEERDLKGLIGKMTELIHEAAASLKFEFAACCRDRIKGPKNELWHSMQAQKQTHDAYRIPQTDVERLGRNEQDVRVEFVVERGIPIQYRFVITERSRIEASDGGKRPPVIPHRPEETMSMPLSTLATTDATQSMQAYMHEWLTLGGLVVALIGMDLFLHLRRPHEPTIKECTRWFVFYVSLTIVSGVYTLFRHSSKFALEYFAAYFTEYSLSTDNIFIFVIIIDSFQVPRKYQQKVLLWGIVTALVLRLIFVLLGATLLEGFSWLFFIFATFLLWTVWNQLHEGVEDRKNLSHDDDVYKPNTVVRGACKVFMVTDDFVGDKILVRRNHKTFITPFFLCIISIESTDLMFALDSIPASFGLTIQPSIIFVTNAFALVGLRQLFFLVEGLLERLVYLHYRLAAILVFIGFKLLVEAYRGQGWLGIVSDIHPLASLTVTPIILVLAVVTSLGKTKRKAIEGTNVEEAGDEIEADRVAQAPREEGVKPGGARKSTDGWQLEELQRSGEERQPGDEQRPGDGSLSGRKGPSNKQPRNWG